MTVTDRGYARISNDTSRSGSIDKQRARIGAYAGGEVEWYEDRSVSGSKVPMWERDGGGKLLADLQRGDRVLITKIDRAARNVDDLLGFVARIEEAGASVRFVDQDIDTSGAMGRFILVLLAAIAELEAEIVRERRMESLTQFRNDQTGIPRFVIGTPPVGLTTAPHPGGRGLMLVKDPETWEAVREAMLMVIDGKPANQGRLYLNEALGLNIQPSNFRNLMANPRFAGMEIDNEYETHRDNGVKKSRIVKEGVVMRDGVPVVNPASQILSIAEWEKLQARPKGNNRRTHNKRDDNYGPALECGTCRQRLYHSDNGKGTSTYRCRRDKMTDLPHPSVSIKIADARIEETFLKAHGHVFPTYTEETDDSAERLGAIALAQHSLRFAQEAYSAAQSDEEEEAALRDQKRAKATLRAAEALPSTRETVLRKGERTIAEIWDELTHPQRVSLMKFYGVYVVNPGRGLPIDQKVTWEPRTVVIDPRDMFKGDVPDMTVEEYVAVHGEVHRLVGEAYAGLVMTSK